MVKERSHYTNWVVFGIETCCNSWGMGRGWVQTQYSVIYLHLEPLASNNNTTHLNKLELYNEVRFGVNVKYHISTGSMEHIFMTYL